MGGDRPRTREARDLAERALGRLLLELGPHSHDVVVIGGLNPELLAVHPAAPHLGTTDVDLLVEVGLVFDRDEMDLRWLELGLRAAGFTSGLTGWRWRLQTPAGPVVLELLCDVPDNRGQVIALPGCETASAMNLEGPGSAMHDTHVVELGGDELEHRSPVTARFAGLGGYLLSKAGAVVGRQLAKDYYDFMFVTLYNEGGPTAAGRATAAALATHHYADHHGNVRATLRRFGAAGDDGTQFFVEQMLISGATDDAAVLTQDAIGAAADFAAAFSDSTTP